MRMNGTNKLTVFAAALALAHWSAADDDSNRHGARQVRKRFSFVPLSHKFLSSEGSLPGLACLLQIRMTGTSGVSNILRGVFDDIEDEMVLATNVLLQGNMTEIKIPTAKSTSDVAKDTTTTTVDDKRIADEIEHEVLEVTDTGVDQPNVTDGEKEQEEAAKEDIEKLAGEIEEEQSVIDDAKAALNETVPSSVSEQPIRDQVIKTANEAIEDTIGDAEEEGRNATKEEVRQAIYDELSDLLNSLKQRSRYAPSSVKFKHGVIHFFKSVAVFDWFILTVAFVFFFKLYKGLHPGSSTEAAHWVGLLIYLMLAVCYFGLISLRQGWDDGLAWIEGYMLEIIFLIENVFVFHIVVSAFKPPITTTESALLIVIVGQVLFQMVFYMGLAHWLRSLHVLPYFLGGWLVYVGFYSAISSGEGDFDFEDSTISRISKALLGERLQLKGMDDTNLWIKDGNKRVLTQTGLMVGWLLLVDFFLEVDVTVAKIEILSNQYLAFSSSVVATFAVPQIFFISNDLFKRYHGLKYGISCVLVLFGLEMLLHRFVEVPAVVAISTMIFVMAVSGILSYFMQPGIEPSLDRQLAAAAGSN